jgi:hypothetical protein
MQDEIKLSPGSILLLLLPAAAAAATNQQQKRKEKENLGFWPYVVSMYTYVVVQSLYEAVKTAGRPYGQTGCMAASQPDS